jgi:hypothetical protein
MQFLFVKASNLPHPPLTPDFWLLIPDFSLLLLVYPPKRLAKEGFSILTPPSGSTSAHFPLPSFLISRHYFLDAFKSG